MIRSLFNFFLIGFLFYLISLYFPEAFKTLVQMAEFVWNWGREVFRTLPSKQELAFPKA